MGTEIEFTINLLTTRPQAKSKDLSVVGGLERIENKGLWKNSTVIGADCKSPDSMDNRLDKNSIESIKKTMQKHEDTFKQQVVELHRLYNMQKLLMDELRNECKQQKELWPSKNSLGVRQSACFDSHYQPTKQTAYELDFRFQSLREDACSRVKSTGACSGDTIIKPMRRGLDLGRAVEENTLARIPRVVDEGKGAGPSSNMAALKSSTTSIDGSDYDESQVELTLSIGGSQTKKRAKSHQLELGCSDSHAIDTRELHYYSSASFKSDGLEDCSDFTNPISSSSVMFDQERQKPRWLFQGLNLK